MTPHREEVWAALAKVEDPELHKDLVSLDMVRDVQIEGTRVSLRVVLTTPACPLKDKIKSDVESALKSLPGVERVDIIWEANVKAGAKAGGTTALPSGVKNVVAIASGKGGVGKSTTAVNVAIWLKTLGARVGLLDADVYGPNIPMMMGIAETDRPNVNGKEQLIPFENHGIQVMSIGFLVEPGKAVIWRGPMLHGIIRQFLTSVQWGELDYLVVDLPPGTGDAPLSLVQTVPLSGAVIVTTPQEVALSDVRRSVAMFQEVRVPVLGIVENMGPIECPQCHHGVPLFSGRGGETLSREYNVPLLASVPFNPSVGQGGDRGVPISLSQPTAPQSLAFRQAAEWVAARISVQNAQSEASRPTIQIG